MTGTGNGDKKKSIPVRHIAAPVKEPGFPENFSIRKIEELLQDQDMLQELHRHDYFYLLALEKGSGHHNIDFSFYTIADYSIFIMRPGQVHSLHLKTGSTGYLLQFSNEFYRPQDKAAKQSLAKASRINYDQMNVIGSKKIISLLDYIYQESEAKFPGFESIIQANISILLIELIRQNTTNISGNNHYAQEQLERFLELLESHISVHKQVSQYAELLCLSAYQLNAITKTLLGKTSSALINEQIILEAKRNLLATTHQISRIAYSLGYEDVSYFIRFFKKQTGYTPEVFRHKFN
ncbi:AraC family transcriptional regulator [Pedobacter nutrimenti]|uniref:helix-turn-helix domain-containing protein n=1 Tax=Pedobacter nutrimenti TaxID=1241337 RepID=UPI00292DAF5F|nr:AraC family transcriptional regulator [Pedobacter nutrimenti]